MKCSKNHQQRKKQEEHIVIGREKGFPLIIAETHSEERLTARYLYSSIPLFLIAISGRRLGDLRFTDVFSMRQDGTVKSYGAITAF